MVLWSLLSNTSLEKKFKETDEVPQQGKVGERKSTARKWGGAFIGKAHDIT